MIKVKDCIGKRVLVKLIDDYCSPIYQETNFIELSPSGKHIKIRSDGEISWEAISSFDEDGRYEIVDILKTL